MTATLEPKPDDFIKTELQKFNVTDAAIAEMRDNFLTITVADFNDKENAALARSRRLEVKNLRVSVEKTRKELKADALKFTQAIDGEARRLTGLLEPIETHLQAQEDIVAKHKEREEAKERARIAAENEAERQRLEAERAKLEAEKAEVERQKAAIEAAKQREADIAAAAERARIETEQRIQREAQQKEWSERLAKEEELRKEASKPDREKLMTFAGQIRGLEVPKMEGEAAQQLATLIHFELKEMAASIALRAANL